MKEKLISRRQLNKIINKSEGDLDQILWMLENFWKRKPRQQGRPLAPDDKGEK